MQYPKRQISTFRFRKALYEYKRDKEALELEIKLNELCESTFLSNAELNCIVRSVSIGNTPRTKSSDSLFRIRATSKNRSSKSPTSKFKKFDFATTAHLYFA